MPEQHRHWYCFSCNKSVHGLYRTGSKNSRSERLRTINDAANESKGQGHAEAPFCTVQFSVVEAEPHIRIMAPNQYYFIKELKKFYWKKPWLHRSTEHKEKAKGRNNVRVGAGGVIRIYGSIKPEPEEIFTFPQHWFNYNLSFFI